MRAAPRNVPAALALLAALALAACAGPTPYRPADGGYGYREQAIEDDRYRVSFAGNAATPRETVENYLLFRAAELTLAQGAEHFTVLRQEVERFGDAPYGGGWRTGIGIGSCIGCDYWSPFHSGIVVAAPLYGGGGDGARRYRAIAEIALGQGPAPPDNPRAYDARQVLTRLAPTVVRPGEEG